jgi:hypothetical protein
MGQLRTDIAAARIAVRSELEERINAVHLVHTNPCP